MAARTVRERKKPLKLPIDAPARRRLPVLLRRSWYGLNQAFRRRIAHLGITPDQFTALRTLLENNGISQRELTRLMASDPNTIASLVSRLESNGLIERQQHERDGRAYCLLINPTGRRKYEAARLIAVHLQTEVLSCLPANQREPFLHQLSEISDACQVACEASQRKAGNTDSRKV